MIKIFYYLIQDFFIRWNHLVFVRRFGILLYKIGLEFAVWFLSKSDFEVSIYRETLFNKDFSPGRSDIDMFVVYRGIDNQKDYQFIAWCQKRKKIIKKWLPFLEDVHVIEVGHFRYLQRLAGPKVFKRDTVNWLLEYGPDVRVPKTLESAEPNFYYRQHYNLLLFQLYTFWGEENLNLRSSYRQFTSFCRMVFCIYRKRNPENNEELDSFIQDDLKVDSDLVNSLKNLRARPRGSYLLIAKMFYWALKINDQITVYSVERPVFDIKILESDISTPVSDRPVPDYKIFTENLDKEKVSAVCLSISKSGHRDIFYLFVEPVIFFDEFLSLVESVLANKKYLSRFNILLEKLASLPANQRIVNQPVINNFLPFPLIVTPAGFNNGYFSINPFFFSAERDIFRLYGKTFYGTKPEVWGQQSQDYYGYLINLPQCYYRSRLFKDEDMDNLFYRALDYLFFAQSGLFVISAEDLLLLYKAQDEYVLDGNDNFSKFAFARKIFHSPELREKIRQRLGIGLAA